MPLPVGLSADAIDSAGGAALTQIGSDLDFCKARVPAFGDNSADFVRAYIQYRRKPGGCGLGVFYNSRLGKNSLNFVAGGKDPASTIQYHAALGPLRCQSLLLFYASASVVVTFEVLQVKAPRSQCQKCHNQKDKKADGSTNAFQFLISQQPGSKVPFSRFPSAAIAALYVAAMRLKAGSPSIIKTL
jgi:hypothetical protein